MLGFSAGGVMGVMAAVADGERAYEKLDATDDASCQANFALIIYPGGLVDEKTGTLEPYVSVTEETPPMFFAHAADDRVTCLSSTAMFTALKLAGASAEVHG